jgi:hypothetical protein
MTAKKIFGSTEDGGRKLESPIVRWLEDVGAQTE